MYNENVCISWGKQMSVCGFNSDTMLFLPVSAISVNKYKD